MHIMVGIIMTSIYQNNLARYDTQFSLMMSYITNFASAAFSVARLSGIGQSSHAQVCRIKNTLFQWLLPPLQSVQHQHLVYSPVKECDAESLYSARMAEKP